MSGGRVLVTGASGLLGAKLAERLAADGWRVRCLVHRHSVDEAHERFSGSLTDPPSLQRAVEGTDAVIHLAAVTHARRAGTYHRTNVVGTRNLVAAAAEVGIARFVFVSTRAINPAGGAYSRSKAEAEAAVAGSAVPFVIVRLPEVYGTGGTEGVDRIIGLAQRNAPIPVAGGGEQICPLYVDDALNACEGALQGSRCLGRTFTLAGECTPLLDFAKAAISAFASRSRIVSVPLPAMRLLSTAARVLPLPVYPDQLARLRAPKPPRSDDAAELLGFVPTPLSAGLRHVVEKVNR